VFLNIISSVFTVNRSLLGYPSVFLFCFLNVGDAQPLPESCQEKVKF